MTNPSALHRPPPQHYLNKVKVPRITKRGTYRSQVIEAGVLSGIPPKIMSPIIWGASTTAWGIVTAATVHFSAC
jgi:hypothetical protein